MKRSIRLWIALVLLAALLSMVFVGCTVPDTQKPSDLSSNADERERDNTPTSSNPGSEVTPTTPTQPTGPGSEIEPTNPSNPGTEITNSTEPTDPGPVDPGTGNENPPQVTITEAEYKTMFYDELPQTIENYFNENFATSKLSKISNVEIIDYNNADGTVFYKCLKNGRTNIFNMMKSSDLVNDSYEEVYSSLDNATFTCDKVAGYTIQEESLANEIAEFALQQDEVISFLAQNGIYSTSNYTVLNATEFYTGNNGRGNTDIILKIGDNILKINMNGSTGICNTQEEYLNKLRTASNTAATVVEFEDYSDLESASASESYTFTSSYGNVKGTMVFNNGIGSMQFEEMGI